MRTINKAKVSRLGQWKHWLTCRDVTDTFWYKGDLLRIKVVGSFLILASLCGAGSGGGPGLESTYFR